MFTARVTPRFGDVDGLRHINNCLIPQWFEMGRDPLFRFFHPDLDLTHWNLIMASIHAEFTAQMRLGSDVEIRTWVKRIGKSSFDVYQEAWQDGILGAWGKAVVVYYDFVNKNSLPIPDDIRDQLEHHMLPPDAGVSGRRKISTTH